MTSSIGKLIWSSVGAVGGTGLVILVGYYFASIKQLSVATSKELSKLTLYFFSGCLMFVNLAESVSVDNLKEMWGIPFMVVVFYLINWLASQIACRVLRIPKLWRFVTASLMFSNNNNWPVALIQALAANHQKDLEWHKSPPSDPSVFASPKNTLASRGLSYIFIYAMFSNLVRWSYGYTLLANSDEPEAQEPEVSDEQSPLLGNDVLQSPTSSGKSVTFADPRTNLRRKSLGTATDEAWSSYEEELEEPDPHPIDTIVSTYQRIRQTQFGNVLASIVGPFDNPPMKASLIGMVFALIAPLKNLLFGPGAPLKMLITVPLRHCGEASVPLTLVGLGVSLEKVMQERRVQASRVQNAQEVKWQKQVNRAVTFICFWRLLVMPVVAVGLVLLLRPYMELLRTDPMFCLVLLVLSSSPTAINLQQIAAVHGHFESELSWCLLWQYSLVTPIFSASVAIWLWWIKSLSWEPVPSL
jgi:predicted permease